METLCDLIPKAVAIGHEGSGLFDTDGSLLGWQQVEEQIVRLASVLVEAGVDRGDRVAVLHPRSSASFLAVHAILRAGAVMVQLDPFGPPAGLGLVLNAVEPRAIIGDTRSLVSRLGDHLATPDPHTDDIVVVHRGDSEPLVAAGIAADQLIDFDRQPQRNDRLPIATPDDPAYIIFTSGSTGVPKGIVHTHASGLAYATMGAEAHALSPSDRLAAISPLHFDQSTLDLYAIPFAGASALAISEAELRFPASLTQHLERDQATIIYTTPYQLTQLMHRGDLANRSLEAIRQVCFGGEAFAPRVLVELGQAFSSAELLNVYGPAEVNGVTIHSFGVGPTDLTEVPIGTPCEGVQVRIVDDNDQLVAAGETGELLVSSPTMMHGYWQRDDLNQACFTTLDNTRFYRTGDLAHTDRSGLLQFHGRSDNLIKVRGVRIELEEIERALEDSPLVAHGAAGRVDDADGMQHIAAWVVPTSLPLDERALVDWCRRRLPANAVPTRIVVIDELPTTATGKIDRATLRDSAADHRAPNDQ